MNQVELAIERYSDNPGEEEILIALLSEKGFDSFEEDDKFIKAYRNEGIDTQDIPSIMQSLSGVINKKYKYSVRQIEDQNWNEVWEKSISPVIIDDRLLVKAPFHDIPDKQITVIIEPKMSFGTGHHETTRLMLREMLNIDFSGLEVLDMGCGTGVLGITASLMGATYVLAVDIDPWAYQNTVENLQLNNIWRPFDVFPGDSEALEGHTFHVILANINRNIILKDLPVYVKALKPEGTLILSGILLSDKDIILKSASRYELSFISSRNENNWISIHLKKLT